MRLINHYFKLFYFAFFRFNGDNYSKMRTYFSSILVKDLSKFLNFNNKKIIDIGGGTGEFCKFIGENYNCEIINLEPFETQTVWKTVKGFANEVPFENNIFDIVIFRGVLEHIEYNKQQKAIDEIFRILKTYGVGYLVIPPWFNFHAGHRLKPFHILPFKIAKKLRNIFFRLKFEQNSLDEANLYKITFRKMIKLLDNAGFEIISTKDTHFRLHFLTKLPIIREIFIPAVAFIVKKNE